jgi:DNA-binding MarR family transcriptional regulator
MVDRQLKRTTTSEAGGGSAGGAHAPPDLAILLTAAGRAVADRLLEAMREAGLEEVRSNHGFVIRAVADGGLTLTALAERLGVSKQAAQKVVDDMERRRLVERVDSDQDRRAKTIRLTKRGQKVRRTALAASKRMEAELRDDLGNATVDAAREALEHFVARHGGLEEARAGRARPIW